MKIFIFSLLIGATVARLWPTNAPSEFCKQDTNAKAEIQIDLDYFSYGTAAQASYEFYWVKYEFQPNGRHMLPVGCSNTTTWVKDWFGRRDSKHIYIGCNYFHVPEFPNLQKNCYNDIDGCSACGYTLEADINPVRPDCDLHWLVNFAHSNNGVPYGFYVGFQCTDVIVWSITSTKSVKKTCSLLGTRGEPGGGWYYFTVRYDPRKTNDVEIYVDNMLLPSCMTVVKNQVGAPWIVHDMIVGGAKNGPGSPVIDELYEGEVNQICWFNRMVSHNERAVMMDKDKGQKKKTGCYWIGSKPACKHFGPCT